MPEKIEKALNETIEKFCKMSKKNFLELINNNEWKSYATTKISKWSEKLRNDSRKVKKADNFCAEKQRKSFHNWW